MTDRWRHLTLCVCVLLTIGAGAGKAEEAKKPDAAASAKAQEVEQQLIADPLRAIPELTHRLRQSVKFQDGLIVVDSPFGMGTLLGPTESFDHYVLPANTPWALSCGMGMTVIFGNVVSGDSSSVTNDVRVALTLAQIDKNGCDTIGVAVGKEILAILAGH